VNLLEKRVRSRLSKTKVNTTSVRIAFDVYKRGFLELLEANAAEVAKKVETIKKDKNIKKQLKYFFLI
jgi:hypothetical protein